MKVDFEVLNQQEHTALTSAQAIIFFQPHTLANAQLALRTARDAYFSFDSGLQHLTFPASMSGDVADQLRRDAQVEADYLAATNLTDIERMHAAIAPVSQILASAATETLRRDLGLPTGA